MGIFFGVASFTYAAEPQFLVSWKSLVYAPNWYEGKLIPTKDSVVQVSFELVDQDGVNKGKVVNVSASEVRWYIGTTMVQKGIGLQTITIKNNLFSNATIPVKISVDFSNQRTGEKYFVEKYIHIPVTERRLILTRPWMDHTLTPHTQATWYAIPFFFSSDPRSLNLTWTVNGQVVNPTSDDPFSLSIQSGDAGQTVDIEASLGNSESLWDTASAFERIYIQ